MREEVEKSCVRRIRSGLPKKERIPAKFHLTFGRSTTGKLPVHLDMVWDGGRYEKDMVLHGLASQIESWLREMLQCDKHRIDSAHLYFQGEKDGAMLEVVFLGKVVCISILGFADDHPKSALSVNRKHFERQVRSMYDYLRTEEWKNGCTELAKKEFTEFSTVPDCEAPEDSIEMSANLPEKAWWTFYVNQQIQICDGEFINDKPVRAFFDDILQGKDGFYYLTMPDLCYCSYIKVWVHGETARVQMCTITESGKYKRDQRITVQSSRLREQAAKVYSVLTENGGFTYADDTDDGDCDE